MSKFEWATAFISASLLVMLIVLYGYWDSERDKRIELEASIDSIQGKCDFQESIIDSAITLAMTTRHTMPDCYLYQSEMSFLIATYYQPDSGR